MGKVLRLNYRAYTKTEAINTLNAIIQSYEKFLTDTMTRNSDQILRLIARARDELGVELNQLEKKYLEFRQKKQVLLTDEKGRSYMAMRLEQLYRATNEAKIKSVTLQEQLEMGKKLAKDGRGLWAVAHAMDQLNPSATAGNLVTALAVNNSSVPLDYLRILTTEQQQLAEKFGSRNARVQEIKDLLDRAQDAVRESRKRLDKGEISDLIGAVEQSVTSVEVMHKSLQREFDEALGEAKKIETDLLTDSTYRENLDRQRSLFNTVVEQLKQTQFVALHSDYTSQTIEYPNWHFGASSPKISIVMGVAFVLGGIVSAAGAIVKDRLDPRLRSAGEVRKILGTPVIGQVPWMSESYSNRPGGLAQVVETLPRSPWAEAYRSARTTLQLLRRNRQVGVILVTSPRAGDGKTTSASNLAITLAHAGKRVLLVNADLRNPSLAKLYGLENQQGLVHILKGVLPPERVTQQTAIENLDLIAAGPHVPNPAELLTSPRLGEFLSQARQSYEFVVVDSSPLLVVTDPTIVGVAVDGVLLVLKAPDIPRRDAEHALDLLETLGLPVLGTFLNGAVVAKTTLPYPGEMNNEQSPRDVGLPGSNAPEVATSTSLTPSENGEDLGHVESPSPQ